MRDVVIISIILLAMAIVYSIMLAAFNMSARADEEQEKWVGKWLSDYDRKHGGEYDE